MAKQMTDEDVISRIGGAIWGWISLNAAPVSAMVMAAMVSVFRIVYDRSETTWQRIMTESVLCGLLSFALSAGAAYFAIPDGVAVFIGGAVGFVGVVKVRAVALKALEKYEK